MSETDAIIIQSLLKKAPGFVSGNAIAEELGISRVAVWARLEKLREAGFVFEAIRHTGYRLVEEPSELYGPLLRAYLTLYGCTANLLCYPELDSTNSEAERQLADGREAPFAVLTSRQRQGRGRLGRKWHSPEEGNCYLSLAFRPQMSPRNMQLFTLWMGVHFCQELQNLCRLPLMLKWPNDLVLHMKKAGGMLTEARIDADSTRDLVFGFGLNVNGRCEEWPETIANGAISLAGAKGEPIPINPLTARLVVCGVRACDEFCRGVGVDEFPALWERYDYLKGKMVKAHGDEGDIQGIAEGIEENGALRLRAEDGDIVRLRAGDVSLGTTETLAPKTV